MIELVKSRVDGVLVGGSYVGGHGVKVCDCVFLGCRCGLDTCALVMSLAVRYDLLLGVGIKHGVRPKEH